ncbi:hypothetical protein KFE25_010786 [Diacronema lutheri]|uniref:FAD-binding domain-containing protein n=2 Tax=Diacronema lutheri TaxID=2081491 RepID=A0A8J6C765_DIALT|nr:hypothetical protein KFE25_010786 [Diacronema lutheri]
MGAAGPRHVDVVVVGAGPTGLAAALELRARGARVAIVDKAPSPGAFDAERAFLYNVDGRGQAVLDSLGLLPALLAASVSQEEFRISIVTDSAEPVSAPVALPTVDMEQRRRTPAQWIPRATLVELMDAAVAATVEQRSGPPAVERIYGYELQSITLARKEAAGGGGASGGDGGAREPPLWSVRLRRSSAGEERTDGALDLEAALVVGADGLGSAVRAQLAALTAGVRARGGAGTGRGGFRVVRRRCASAGLRYKVLALPPAFRLSRRSSQLAQPSVAYSIRSAHSARRPVRAGLLPLRTDEAGRTANFITAHDHPLWEQRTPEQIDAYLRDTFPHVPLDAAHIGAAELARFARSAGGHFPQPQHCTDAALVPTGAAGCAAVLAGDALHAFPPDLGQGVNAGLQDVGALAAQLDAHAVRFGAADGRAQPRPPAGLAAAAVAYGAARAPEAAALTRLVQLGYPFQYSQEKFLGKARQAWWALNLLLRLRLSKLAPALFHPQIFTLVQNPALRYTEILARANVTTRNLQLAAVALLAFAAALARGAVALRALVPL